MTSSLKPLFAAALLVAGAQTLAAQETVASYYAALGPQDFQNSRGDRLTDFGAVLQQDRANYHRFGQRDRYDEGDPVFGNPEARSRIPALFAAGDNAWWAGRVTPPSGRPLDADVLVVICATDGRLSHIIVNHANGDGYMTCEGSVTAGQ